MVTFPWWFEIFLAWFLLTIIMGVVRYFTRDKRVHKIDELPTERKEKILESCAILIKIYKFFFWASPLYLVVIPFIIYKQQPAEFFHMTTMQIAVFITILQDFLYRKFLLKKIKQD